MGRWEVRNGLGWSWHPEPPVDEEGRRAGDQCGDELWHLQISFGHVDFCAGSGLGGPSLYRVFGAFPTGKTAWEKRCAVLRIALIPSDTLSQRELGAGESIQN